MNNFAKQYPETIAVNHRQKNMGASKNWVQTMRECTGKYIAFLEGDDYWIDPLKLQTQVDILEADKDKVYVGCFHNNYLLQESNVLKKKYRIPLKKTIKQHNLLYSCIPHTATFIFRSQYLPQTFPDWFMTSLGSDWTFHIILTNSGDYYYIDKVMSVYRIQPEGICTKTGPTERGILIMKKMFAFNKYLSYKYNAKVKWGIARLAYTTTCRAESERNWKSMRIACLMLLKTKKYNKKISWVVVTKLTLVAVCPGLKDLIDKIRTIKK